MKFLQPINLLKLLVNKITNISNNVVSVNTFKEILGNEGQASKIYFSALFSDFGWYRRMPRTKVDEINYLMDIGYTMLFNMVDAISALFGFDIYKGFYHKLFFQRKSLACDLVEPFRCLIDKQIIKSYHLNQIDKKDFKCSKGSYSLKYDKRQKYLKFFAECLMKNKEDIFCYIRDYYYSVMNDSDFPNYKLK